MDGAESTALNRFSCSLTPYASCKPMATPRRVADIHPGFPGSFPAALTAVGDSLLFHAHDGTSGFELWKSDGKSATQVSDIHSGPESSFPAGFTTVGNATFFSASDASSGHELWEFKTDSASLFADINPGPGSSSPRDFQALGDDIYFYANDGSSGTQIWRTFARSVVRVTDLKPEGDLLKAVKEDLFFDAKDGITGYELWKTNGTSEGTSLFADLNPGPGESLPRDLIAVGENLFFTADDGISGRELWKIGGTPVGTVRVADIRPGDEGSSPNQLTAVGETLFFSANDGSSGYELWASDGTAAGTLRVADIRPGIDRSRPVNLVAVGDTLFFSANDGSSGYELWKSDGTAAGTLRVADIRPGIDSSDPRSFTAVGDTLFFSANDGSSGNELWKSDGTAAGTVRVADIRPGIDSSDPRHLTTVGNTLFFSADDGSSGTELWALDLETEPDRYLAFSGGGWNTHSLLAGFFAGALDVMEDRGSAAAEAMDDLMKNVKGIGAISGGSWFLSHLAYSQKFLQQFDSKTERNAYTTTGYNGALIRTLENVLRRKLKPAIRSLIKSAETLGVADTALDQFGYVAKLADFLGETQLDWRAFVEQLVYKPLGMLDELADRNLEAPRQPWAQDKDLIIATAISTADSTLHTRPATLGDDRIFSRADPTLPGAQARPLGLRSIASQAGGFVAVADDPASGDLVLHYSNDQLLGPRGKRVSLDVRGGIPLSPNLSIIDATVASSSALAAVAQPAAFQTLLDDAPLKLRPALRQLVKTLTTGLRRLSPLARFRRGGRLELDIPATAATEPDFDRLYRQASQAAEVRLMDGGYVDNAPAAYTLRHIQQQQDPSQPFDLTLFFNSSIDPLTGVRMNVAESGNGLSSFRLPADLAQLFGRTVKEAPATPGSLVDGPFPGLRNKMPSPQIFAESAWRGESAPEWEFQRGNLQIRYFDLDVTTVANRQFGIVGGQSGRVRLFTSNNADSFAAPVQQSILNEYNLNYLAARSAIREFGGAEFMLDALGIAENTTAI
jgi:ELWxxDGT repeat protein